MIWLLLALAGCTPTCEQVCNKLVGCENPGTEMLAADDCRESCEKQRDLYQSWTDESLRDAFDESLSCYQSESCDAIAKGVCYNSEIWSW